MSSARSRSWLGVLAGVALLFAAREAVAQSPLAGSVDASSKGPVKLERITPRQEGLVPQVGEPAEELLEDSIVPEPFPGQLLAFGPDGRTLSSVGLTWAQLLKQGGSARPLMHQSWDILTGRLLEKQELRGPQYSCETLWQVSPRGQLLCEDQNLTVLISPERPGARIGLEGEPSYMRQAAFSADGEVLAALQGDDKVLLWNTRTGRLLGKLPTGFKREDDLFLWSYSLYLSADGAHLLIVGTKDSGESEATYIGRASGKRRTGSLPGNVKAVGFGPDGLPRIICKVNEQVQLWRLGEERSEQVSGFSIPAGLLTSDSKLFFTPEARLLVVSNGSSIRALDLELGTELWNVPLYGHLLQLSHDGRYLAVGGTLGDVQIIDVASGLTRSLVEANLSDVLQLNADGSKLAVFSTSKDDASPATPHRSYRVQGWELGSATLEHGYLVTAPIEAQQYTILHKGPDETILMSGDAGGGFQWTLGRDLKQTPRTIGKLFMLSPTGRLVADVRNGKVILKQGDQPEQVLEVDQDPEALVFSPDESRLYGAAKGKLFSWDLRTKRLEPGPRLPTNDVELMSVGPSGHVLIHGKRVGPEGQQSQQLWLINPTGSSMRLPDIRAYQFCREFTPDGKTLLLGAFPQRLYELTPGGAKARAFQGLTGKDVLNCNFSSLDGRRLVFSTTDGDIRVVSWPDLKPVAYLRAGENWFLQRGDRVFRNDDGRLLYQRDSDGRLKPVAPAVDPQGTPELVVAADVSPSPGEARQTGVLTVHVRNTGKGDAYWVTVEPRSLPAGVTFWPSAPLPRLRPGEAHDIKVQLASVNPEGPRPRDEVLPLSVRHAHGEHPLTVPVSFGAPWIDLADVSTKGDSESAVTKILVRNIGAQDSGTLRLTARFLRGEQPIGNPVGYPSLESLKPAGAVAEKNPSGTFVAIPLPRELHEGREGFRVELTLRGELWPTHRWVLTTPVQRLGQESSPTLGIALGIILVVLAGAGFAFVVVPRSLWRSSLPDLRRSDRIFRRLRVLELMLARAQIPRGRWERAVSAAEGSEAAARALAEALGARLGASIPGLEKAWDIQLPPLHLRFEEATALLVCEGRDLDEARLGPITQSIHRDGKGPSHALLLDFTENQHVMATVSRKVEFDFFVLTLEALRDILLSKEPLVKLEQIIAAQRPVSTLALYQTNGGLQNERLFVGRKPELKTVLGSGLRNFVVVAARQSGKSSFLQALKRRLAERTDVEVFYVASAHSSLADAIADELKQPRPEDKLGFRKLAQGTRERPRVWLVDETDEFVEEDRKQGFQQTMVMRELAEGGLAYFILAGSWQLYRAVYFDPLNPLRNFAERIELGPLDPEAARELATRPLQVLGVSFDSPGTVQYLIEQTGCRANLVAITCNEMVKSLGPTERILTRARLEEVLEKSTELRNALTYYRLSPPLDRAVLRAALLVGARPTRAEIRKRLEAAGASLRSEELDHCLENLQLAYLLLPDGTEVYRCPVPLLRRLFDSDSEKEQRLRDDIEEAEDHQSPEGGIPRTAVQG